MSFKIDIEYPGFIRSYRKKKYIVILECSSIIDSLIYHFTYYYITISLLISEPFPCCTIPDSTSTLACFDTIPEQSKSYSTDIIDIYDTSSCRICRGWKCESDICCGLIDIKCSFYIYCRDCCTDSTISCKIR